ncbi:MAG: AlpA family phage regulatory protein [Sphingopyxis sp.]
MAVPHIRSIISVSARAALYRKVKDGSFPARVKMADRCCGWREFAIVASQRDPDAYNAAQSLRDPEGDRDSRFTTGA